MVERVFLGLCLFSVLVCFSACKNKSQNAANEHQNEALSQAFAQMNGMEKKKEEVERIAEQRERERQRDSDAREWLRGTWEYRDSYGDVVCRLAVNNGCACLYTASGVSDDGHISKFDVDEGQMTFGEHSYVEFDYDKRKLYYSRMENQCLTKIDNTPKISYNNMTRGSGGATYARRGSSTRGAAQGGTKVERLMAQYNEQNEMGLKLATELEGYLRNGQVGPWLIANVHQQMYIADEKVRIARKIGDEQLIAIAEMQREQLKIAMKRMNLM